MSGEKGAVEEVRERGGGGFRVERECGGEKKKRKKTGKMKNFGKQRNAK